MIRKLHLAGGLATACLLVAAFAPARLDAVVRGVDAIGPSVRAPEVVSPATVAVVDARGAGLVHDSSTLAIPPGALEGPEEIAMRVVALPAPLAPGFRVVSPVLRLTKGVEGPFAAPVRVSVPIVEDPALDECVAVYWDVPRSKYTTVTVVETDEARRTLDFETVHFTDFVVVAPVAKSGPLADVKTGFRPERDGFSFSNTAYRSQPGLCLGMSLLAAWYFDTKTRTGEPPLRERIAATAGTKGEQDARARAMAFLAQHESHTPRPDGSWVGAIFGRNPVHATAYDQGKKDGPLAAGLRLHEQLRATGSPQILGVGWLDGKGHAVLVFGYEDGAFLAYDPNHPNETRRYPFDKKRGFHGMENTIKDDAAPKVYAPASYSSWAGDVDFERALATLLAAPEVASRTVTIRSVTRDGDKVAIEGQVPRKRTGWSIRPEDDAPLTVEVRFGDMPYRSAVVDPWGYFRIVPTTVGLDAIARKTGLPPSLVVVQDGHFVAASMPLPEIPPPPTPPSSEGFIKSLRARSERPPAR